MTEDERHAAGMQVRRKVLGDAHVDRAESRRTEFSGEIQDYITRQVWGSIWTRPGLDIRTRSCIALTVMMALGRWEEFRLHVKAAFNCGLGKTEIREVILQNTAYCGAPVGNHALAEAEAVFRDEGL